MYSHPDSHSLIVSCDLCASLQERAPLVDEHERQRAQQFDQQVDFNTTLIIEREDAIAEIERTMYGDSVT